MSRPGAPAGAASAGKRPLFKPSRSSLARGGNGGGGEEGGLEIDLDMRPPNEEEEDGGSRAKAGAKKEKQQAAKPGASALAAAAAGPARAAAPASAAALLSPSNAPGRFYSSPSLASLTTPPATAGGASGAASRAALLGQAASANLVLTPAVVEFFDVNAGALQQLEEGHSTQPVYFMLLSLQNRSSRRRAIKVTPPATDQFSVEMSAVATEVAPGLSVKLKVYFQPPPPPRRTSEQSDEEWARAQAEYASRSWHDRLLIASYAATGGSDGTGPSGTQAPEKIVVPLHAYSPRPILVHDTLIDFGSVATGGNAGASAAGAAAAGAGGLGAQASQTFRVRNDGSVPASFRLDFDRKVFPAVSVSPPGVIHLAPAESTEMHIDLSVSEVPLGAYRALGRLVLEGGAASGAAPVLIDLQANIVEASLQLIWPTVDPAARRGTMKALKQPGQDELLSAASLHARQLERVSEVSFGSTYFGEARRVDTLLYNNSPRAMHFVVHVADARDGHDKASAAPGGEGADSHRIGAKKPTHLQLGGKKVSSSSTGEHDADSSNSQSSSSLSSGPSSSFVRPDLVAQPSEGRLAPFGVAKVSFIFQPSMSASRKRVDAGSETLGACRVGNRTRKSTVATFIVANDAHYGMEDQMVA